MANDALLEVFREVLNLEELPDPAELKYNVFPGWDSVAHMTLVAAIEDRFNIMLETDEILDMSDFDKALQIVASHDGNA